MVKKKGRVMYATAPLVDLVQATQVETKLPKFKAQNQIVDDAIIGREMRRITATFRLFPKRRK